MPGSRAPTRSTCHGLGVSLLLVGRKAKCQKVRGLAGSGQDPLVKGEISAGDHGGSCFCCWRSASSFKLPPQPKLRTSGTSSFSMNWVHGRQASMHRPGDIQCFTQLPYQIEFYSEDLDASLFSDEASQRQFRDWYSRKYSDRKPDLILAIGPSPIKFMAESHDMFFPQTPIVFWASTEEFAKPPKLALISRGVGTAPARRRPWMRRFSCNPAPST